MKTWQYLVVLIEGEVLTSDGLNDYGSMGWELVTVGVGYSTLQGKAAEPGRFYIFKRPED